MTAEIRTSHLLVNGVRYFRGNATAVSLGDYGRKKTPIFGMNYLEVYGNAGLVGVDLSVQVELEFEQGKLQEAMGGVSLAFAGNQTAGVSATTAKSEEWNLSLVQLAMSLRAAESNVLDEEDEDDFERLGKKARIVSQVWVVVEAEQAKKIKGAASVKATAAPGGVIVTGEGGVEGTTRTLLTLSEGSTFAYLLAKRKPNSYFTTDQHGPA